MCMWVGDCCSCMWWWTRLTDKITTESFAYILSIVRKMSIPIRFKNSLNRDIWFHEVFLYTTQILSTSKYNIMKLLESQHIWKKNWEKNNSLMCKNILCEFQGFSSVDKKNAPVDRDKHIQSLWEKIGNINDNVSYCSRFCKYKDR